MEERLADRLVQVGIRTMTGHVREQRGFSVRQALAVIQSLTAPLVGADFVEFNPAANRTGVTAAVSAKLVKELAGRMLVEAR